MPGLLVALALAAGPAPTGPRPDAAGDVYRYRSEARYAERNADGVGAQVNSQVFDLEVLGASADGLRLRFTLRETTVSDTTGPAMKVPLKAAVGVPLEFRIDRRGLLTGLDNWPAYHDRFLAAVDAALPAGDEIRNIVHQRMDQAPTDAAQDMVLGDLALMRGVELRGPATLGRAESLDTRHRPAAKVVTETSMKTAGCVVRVYRVTTGTTPGVMQTTTADAEVSMKDGHVLNLSQNRIERAGGSVIDERLSVKRLSAAPACS
ncbi:hypothetical protein [Phenylobacterium sp.]|uniref:hypothetical protein n=1 Tax=Phenylobacterium sp. TaxID=1871053 RepID=UPI0025DB6388|nr:hypothetical protein [Phenylobacterium sp.]